MDKEQYEVVAKFVRVVNLGRSETIPADLVLALWRSRQEANSPQKANSRVSFLHLSNQRDSQQKHSDTMILMSIVVEGDRRK